MFVCSKVRVCGFLYADVYVCMCAAAVVRMHVSFADWMPMCVCACVCASQCVYVYVCGGCICVSGCMYACMAVCVIVDVCMRGWMSVCMTAILPRWVYG